MSAKKIAPRWFKHLKAIGCRELAAWLVELRVELVIMGSIRNVRLPD